MASRSNVRKRGATWTYYVYATTGDGQRRQASKGGFRTRKEAEAARIAALAALQSGTWVRPERVTVREYLEDEWLPTQAPPTLEGSTYRSYRRYVKLHVVPYIGALPLQQLTPLDLTTMYRTLLESGRRPPTPPKRVHAPEVGALIDRLRAEGLTWDAIAGEVACAFPEESSITRHAVAALYRRHQSPPVRTPAPDGLKPRTVLYVHSIVHAALKDAMRWNRVARNVGDAATPPPVGSTRQGRRTTWTANGGVGAHAPARYRHDDVKNALATELHKKCAYCESRISHVAYGHIEHILPKAERPELVVAWENLTLACPVCNQHKSNYYDPAAPLVHPYAGQPEAEIRFVGPMARAEGHSAGYRTIQRCKLNRGDLLLERLRVLEQVEQLVRHAATIDDPAARQFVLDEAESLGADDSEYAVAVRTHLTLVSKP